MKTSVKSIKLSSWDEFLERRFRTDNPENEPNVSQKLPDDFMDSDLEFSYDLKGIRSEFVWCSHCKKNNHHKGFLMRSKSGQGFMIGQDCGKKLFGLQFGLAYNTFKQQQDRQARLIRLDRIIQQYPKTLTCIDNILKDPTLQFFNSSQLTFKNQLRYLFAELSKNVDPKIRQLELEVQIPDTSSQKQLDTYQYELNKLMEKRANKEITVSEMKQERKFIKSKMTNLKKHIEDNPPKYYTKRKLFGTISGFGFINRKVSIDNIQRERKILKKLEVLWNGDTLFEMPNNELSQLTHKVKNSCEKIRLEIIHMKSIIRFHKTSNLITLCKWANKNHECLGEYELVDNKIFFYENGISENQIEYICPPKITLPKIDELEKMLDAISHLGGNK